MEVPGKQNGNLSSFSLQASDDTDQLYCLPCMQYESMIPVFGYCQNCAEHLCETCYKSHMKPAPCRNHVLLDKTQMPKSLINTSKDYVETCNQHRRKLIEYFCKDHQKLGCSTCITMNHRTCQVDYIPDVFNSDKTSSEYESLIKSLQTLQLRLEKLTENAKENKERIKHNLNEVKADINNFRQEINAQLDIWEAMANREAEQFFSSINKRLDLTLEQCKEMKSINESQQKLFQSLEKNNDSSQLFIHSKDQKRDIQKDFESEQKLEKEIQIDKYIFQPNKTITCLLQTETRFGTILSSVLNQSRPQLLPRSFKSCPIPVDISREVLNDEDHKEVSAHFESKVVVQTRKERYYCVVKGITVIDYNRIAVTDYSSNQRIKIIDVTKRKIVSKLALSSRPCGVTLLPHRQLAVTLPEEHCIQLISFSDGLSEERKIIVNEEVYGLASCAETLIVGLNKGRVKMINLLGKVLKTISFGIKDDIYHLTISSNNKYIYSSCGRSVICFDMTGDAIGTITNKANMCGLATLKDGSVLVCDYQNRCIYMMTADLTYRKVFLQKMDMAPYCIAVDTRKKKLFVGDNRQCDSINIYRLK